MSFLAKLKVDGKEYNILHCSYNFKQPTDGTGKPAARPLGGQIRATIESDGKYDLLHWMTSPDQTKDGSVVFYKHDAMSKLQEVIFLKAYCTSLEVEFDALDDSPLQKTIVISAKSLRIGDMKFDNMWGEQHYGCTYFIDGKKFEGSFDLEHLVDTYSLFFEVKYSSSEPSWSQILLNRPVTDTITIKAAGFSLPNKKTNQFQLKQKVEP